MLLSDEQRTALAGLCRLQMVSATRSNNLDDRDRAKFWGDLLGVLAPVSSKPNRFCSIMKFAMCGLRKHLPRVLQNM